VNERHQIDHPHPARQRIPHRPARFRLRASTALPAWVALIARVVVLHVMSRLPQAILFWTAYVLTRPLGATLTKPHAQGGLAFGRLAATCAIGAVLVLLIAAAPSLRKAAKDFRTG